MKTYQCLGFSARMAAAVIAVGLTALTTEAFVVAPAESGAGTRESIVQATSALPAQTTGVDGIGVGADNETNDDMPSGTGRCDRLVPSAAKEVSQGD